MSTRNKTIVAAALATASFAAALSLGACGRSVTKEAAGAPPAPQVDVAEVVVRPLGDWEEFTGRLEAVQSVDIRPRVSGFVDQVSFEEGGHVKKGQVLFRIDPRPFQAEVDRLQAQRVRAQSQLGLSKADHDRAKRLMDANAISREEFERLSTADSTAGSDVAAADAALASAKLNLEFTEVRAPIDGRVSRALITAGNLVSSSDVLTTLVSDNPVYAYFDADERTFLQFSKANANGSKKDEHVFMGLIDETGFPHEGRLDFVDNRVDAQSGTIHGRAVFDNADGHYTPGLFARLRLIGGDVRDTVLIDERAVETDLGRKYVLVVKSDNSLEYRLIELGQELGGLRVVRTGLKPGDVIVVNGLQRVKPGATVSPQHTEMDASQVDLKQIAAASAERAPQMNVSLGAAGGLRPTAVHLSK